MRVVLPAVATLLGMTFACGAAFADDDSGAMGVILNRPLPVTLAQICEESRLPFHGDDCATAWRGGPVDPQRGIVLVRGGMPSADDTVLDFTDFISYRKDLLESLLLEPAARFRLFLGYAGWCEGQLDQELDIGSWARLPLNPAWLMTNEPTELWTRAIQSISN